MRRTDFLLHVFLMQLILFLTESARAVSNCNNLGKFDQSLNKCICDPGFKGPKCSQFDFVSKPDQITSYTEGLLSPKYSSWGSGPVLGYNYTYLLAETFTNRCGVACWPYSSVCAIWRKNSTGTYEFVAVLANFPGNDPNKVPYCHDIRMTVEMKEVNGVIKYALVGYATPKINRKTKQYQDAYFGSANSNICGRNIKKFPFSIENRILHVLYKELNATTEIGIRKEVDSILSTRHLVNNINNFNISEYVNTEFTWVNMQAKISPRAEVYSVNPQPLINAYTNRGTLITRPGTQEKARVLMYRFSTTIRGKVKEFLEPLSMLASKFPWEADAKFIRGATLRYPKLPRQEDAFFHVRNNTLVLTAHDLDTCGRSLAQSCGVIITARLDDSRDFLINRRAWGNPEIAYTNAVPNLGKKPQYRQRPAILFDEKGNPDILETGVAWPDSGLVNGECNSGKYGPSRTFPARIRNVAV